MTKQNLIDKTIKVIQQLPPEKVVEVSDFAEFVLKRYEEQKLTEGLQKVATEGHVFSFLREEEELYSRADLKKLYND